MLAAATTINMRPDLFIGKAVAASSDFSAYLQMPLNSDGLVVFERSNRQPASANAVFLPDKSALTRHMVWMVVTGSLRRKCASHITHFI